MTYLAGAGRANEHTDPHLVAGDSSIMAFHGDDVLDRATALKIARNLDHARRAYAVEVPSGSVWHCSLSLKAEEGRLPDERWAAIAEEFVDGMGFSEGPDRAACRWVAVHHGLSKAGNDHIHLAVSLVREDGTCASVWNDRPRAQERAGQLERRHGLQVLESRSAGRGDRGIKPGEREIAQRNGAAEPARLTLERTVRASAAASADEAEFVRRLRRSGLLARPRFAAGRDDVVAGYSVALRPSSVRPDAAPVFYGGGHLARDLTMPRLRTEWPDSPEHASAAAAEWKAAGRGTPARSSGRESTEVDPALWEQCAREVAAMREHLRAVPVDDVATWAHVARQTSGAFAAWSLRVEQVPGPLAETAAALASSAQVRAHRVQDALLAGLSPSWARGAAMVLAAAAEGGDGPVGQAVLVRQLRNTVRALHDAHMASGEAHRAELIATAMRAQLEALRSPTDTMTPATTAQVQAETVRPRALGSPLPAPLPLAPTTETVAARRRSGASADGGAER
ncbi:relaxase/mobilization nuclease domain-containing protein [Quadrisphaera sp. INWT6]|uniref:relaxase/mobilization nuclease domain-containing protein n=1 Tax=Quadrisphaera sp. INWT6 TaxID=2596917 RepID=UPI001892375F|nr:relaxase [Quadrisphaera sp. INWT6]MBF5083749.1 relaxase [Quadrisphaera sp. INWT6]